MPFIFKKNMRLSPFNFVLFFAPFVGLLTFIVYSLTVSTTIYPGQSAYLTAVAAGLQDHTNLNHPLFTQLTHAIAQVPIGTVPFRLNMACCIFASLAAMLFYRFIARIIFFTACEDPGGLAHVLWKPKSSARYDDEERDDSDDAESDGVEEFSPNVAQEIEQQHRHAAIAAFLGGVGATVFFSFSAPFWIVATRLFADSLHCMLMLLMVNLALNFWYSQNKIQLFVCTFLAAILWIETPTTALCCILILLFIIAVVLRGPFATWNAIGCMVAGLLFGLSIAFSMLWVTAAHANFIATLSPATVFSSFFQSHIAAIHQEIPMYDWVAISAYLIVPSVLAMVLIKEGFQRRSWLVLATEIVLGLLLIPTIINHPTSIWNFAQQQSIYPVVIFLFLATQLGFLIALGYEMHEAYVAQKDEEIDDYEYRDNPWVCKIGYALCWPLFLFTLTTPYWYFMDVQTDSNSFLTRIAQSAYQQLKTHDWIVNDDITHHYLALLAHAEARNIYFLSTETPLTEKQKTICTTRVETDPTLNAMRHRLCNALDLSPAQFIENWLRGDTNACKRLAFLNHPELLRNNGYEVLACGLFLIGQRQPSNEAIHENVDRFVAWSNALRPLLENHTPFRLKLLEDSRKAICKQLSRVANELAILLYSRHQDHEALTLLAHATEMDKDNVAVAVNRHFISQISTNNAAALSAAEHALKQIPNDAFVKFPTAEQIQEAYGTFINTNHFRRLRTMYWVEPDTDQATVITFKKHNVSNHSDNRKQQQFLRSLIVKNMIQHNLDQAEQQLHVLLEFAPTDSFAQVNLMTIALYKNNFENAQQWMQKVKTSATAETDLIFYEAYLLTHAKKYDAARKLLEQGLINAPADLRLWELLSEILIVQKEFNLLENRVYPSVRMATNMEEHYLTSLIRAHVMLYRSPEQFTGARILFQRAVRLNPALEQAWLALFALDEEIENPSFYETDAKALLMVQPTHARANCLLGQARLMRGQSDRANDLFNQALLFDPYCEAAYAGRAEIHMFKKEFEAAQTCAAKAFELNKNNARVQRTLIKINLECGHIDVAEKLLATSVSDKKNPHIQLLTAHLLFKKNKTLEAEKILENILTKREQLPPFIVSQASALLRQINLLQQK